MSTCSIQNQITKEPEVFYKSDTGVVYSSLYDVLNNSGNFYETGVMNQAEDFVKLIQTPVFDKSTPQGKIQGYIRQGYLTGSQVAPNTFEAHDSYAAEILEKDLMANEYNTFKRNGLRFEFGDFVPVIPRDSSFKIAEEAVQEYMGLKNPVSQPRPINYSKDQLQIMIENFMKKIGYSIESLENYKKNYKTKFGVEPDAEALIDFNNQVLAFADGKITLDQLSEEFSHFVIEAWNQDDIQRMLPYLNNTQEYIEHAQKYREIYSKEIKDPSLLEEQVRREILGKMLANSLQKDFNPQNRTETERNILQRLSDILRQFFDFIRGKNNPDVQAELDVMAQEIQNMLYNDNLEKSLNLNITPITSLMYSLDKKGAIALKDKLKDFADNEEPYTSEQERQVDELFNTAYSTAVAANQKLESTEGVHDSILDNNIVTVLDMEELLAHVRTIFKKTQYKFPDPNVQSAALRFRESIIRKADKTLKELSELRGNYKHAQEVEASVTVERLLEKHTSLGEDKIREISETVKKVQKDTTAFIRVFGHTAKTSNIFVNVLSKIIENLQYYGIINYEKDVKELINPLIEYKDKLKNFVKNGNFRSGVDNEKLYNDERNYELSILKQIFPDSYKDVDLDGYIQIFQKSGKIPVDTSEDIYYKFRYLYDKGLPNQKWLNNKSKEYKTKFNELLDSLNLKDPWTNEFYKYLINKSNSRFRNDASSIQADREMSNPYYNEGSLKEGFTSMFYGYAKTELAAGRINKEQVVSTNTRHTLFEGSNEPKDTDLVFVFKPSQTADNMKSTDGKNAYYSMKWNSLRARNQNENIQDDIQANFIQEYESQKRILERKGLEGMELNKAMREWLNNSLMFEPTDEYWESFNTNGGPSDIRFRDFYGKVSSRDDRERMEEMEKSYRELQLRKRLILRKYKFQNDYKEIDVKLMSSLDKGFINQIESQLGDLIREIREKFEKHNLGKIFSDSKLESNLKLNQAFHEIFRETIGKSFDDVTDMKELELFFSNPDNMATDKFISYGKLKSDLKNKRDTPFIEQYRDIAESSEDLDILKAFLLTNAPSWFKRFDSNAKYDNFIRDYNNGAVDIVSLVDSYIQNPSLEQIRYKRIDSDEVDTIPMRIAPSFKYSVPSEPNAEELYQEYLGETNPMRKLEIIQEMGGIKDIDPSYSEDISDITGNSENLKVYLMMMDAQLKRLSREGMMKKHYIFLMNQARKSGYERIETFVKNKNKGEQTKDFLKETFLFREDDFEDSYKSLKIPHYGYYKLRPEELTDDVFYALSQGLSNANHYEQRLIHWREADSAIKGLEAQEFEKGKRAIDTNYHQMMKEMMDFNFYGKTVTSKIEFEVNILGKQRNIDLSKFLFGLKSFGITSALAFSPIVAATNFSSGVIQNAMMTATGRNIYSPSNKRAVGILGKLMPDSLKDIGRFDPESKINKIMYGFGIYNLAERHQNAKYNRTMRLLPEAGFSMMALTNFPLEAQSTLTKLMEYRLIDGKFKSWRQYSLEEKTKNPDLTNTDIKTQFEAQASRSMYDYLDDEGLFDTQKLEQDGYKGDIDKDKVMVMGSIRSITEQTTMEIAKFHEGSGGRNPAWSFILSLKKWLVMATSAMTSRKRTDLDTGGEEEGLMYTPGYLFDLFKSAIKDKENIREIYSNMSELEQKNIRMSMVASGIMTVMLALAIVLKKAADDDDEEENYLLQLSSYMALRSLNESFSGNIGIGQAYFEAVQNPIMIATTIKNMTNIAHVGDIGKEVESGKYQGMDKWVSSILKGTYLRNPYSVSSASIIGQTRQSYEHFNTKDSFYHIFDLIPAKPREDEK